MHISVKMQEWDAFAQPLVTRSETGGRVPTTVALYIHKSMRDNRLSGPQMQLEHFAFSDSSPSSSSPSFLPSFLGFRTASKRAAAIIATTHG